MIIQGLVFALSVLCLPWVPSTLYDWLSCPEHLQRTLCLDTEDTSPEFPIPAEQVKRVAIIGAGSGGLAALKTFIHDIPKPDGQRWEIELLEQRSGLGGIWSAQRRDPGLILTDLFYNIGYKMTIQPGIHTFRKHHSTLNCARTPLPQQVITNLPTDPLTEY